jgi:hypothetical protein
MKNPQHILSALAVMVLAFITLVAVYSVAQDQQSTVPTKKELRTLLKSAKEPSEHLRIAAYYQQEAQWLTTSSKEHAELAGSYAKNPPFPRPLEAKLGHAVMGASHYCKWANLTLQAKEEESLAALHEDMGESEPKAEVTSRCSNVQLHLNQTEAVFPFRRTAMEDGPQP